MEKNAKSSKTNSLNKKGSESNTEGGYANLQSFGPVTAGVGAQKFPIERNVWAPGTTARARRWWSPAPVSSQRKRSRLSDTSVQGLPAVGLPSPVPLRTIPDPKKVEASLRHGHGDRGSVVVPSLAGAVRVIDGQRVGLGVEDPVLGRQHVIFREQKIEVSVWRGRGRERG